jgi:hypothetical protein
MDDLTDLFNQALAPDADVWLIGCNTASGEQNGARRMSRILPGRTIHGNTWFAVYFGLFNSIGSFRAYKNQQEL